MISSKHWLDSEFKKLIILSRCLCLFPLDSEKKTKWYSWKLIHIYLIFGFSVFKIVSYCFYVYKKGFSLNEFVLLITSIHFCILLICYKELGGKWLIYLNQWKILGVSSMPEEILKQMKLKLRLCLILYVVIGAAYITSEVRRFFPKQTNANFGVLKTATKAYFFYICENIECSEFLGVLLFLHRLMLHFAWIFSDFFIIVTSALLAHQFKEFNRKLSNWVINIKCESKKLAVNTIPIPTNYEQIWRNFREQHGKLFQLSSSVDDHFTSIIFYFYLSNIIYTLIRLYTTLEQQQNSDSVFTNPFNLFANSVFRMIVVSLIASSISEESKKPLFILVSVPSEIYCEEADRWLDFLMMETASLTGNQLFHVKKGLLLNIAGAIVTYELILLQFSPALKA